MTNPTPTKEYSGLPQEIQESLRAKRIDLYQAGMVRTVIDKYGIERGLAALKHLEKLNSISDYYESVAHGFKIHEFTFNCQSTSPEEAAKIAAALKEALATLSFYSRMGGC